jgi:hypothetical protein
MRRQGAIRHVPFHRSGNADGAQEQIAAPDMKIAEIKTNTLSMPIEVT